MSFLGEYGMFLAKIITLVMAVLLLAAGMLALRRQKDTGKGYLTIEALNDEYEEMTEALNREILSDKAFKKFKKSKTLLKKNEKKSNESRKKRLFILDFDGDMKASAVTALREEITAILNVATKTDEIVLRLESGGGLVSNYGLAASQLARIRQNKIPLTVIIDKIAASGGYLMASVGHRIISAPFAIIGSIGVIAQLPNFHRVLEKHEIDFEQITSGEYKRTLTLFGKNTEKARKKMQAELEDIHHLFKHFIIQHRPNVDLAQVATGEYWLGHHALELKLVDELMTSDEYLARASKQAHLFVVRYAFKKSLLERLSANLQAGIERGIEQAWFRATHKQYW